VEQSALEQVHLEQVHAGKVAAFRLKWRLCPNHAEVSLSSQYAYTPKQNRTAGYLVVEFMASFG
jgi:hypothetical protein